MAWMVYIPCKPYWWQVVKLSIKVKFVNVLHPSLGLLSEPKYGHLKDLHAAIKLCEPALVAADSPQYIKLGFNQEVWSKP